MSTSTLREVIEIAKSKLKEEMDKDPSYREEVRVMANGEVIVAHQINMSHRLAIQDEMLDRLLDACDEHDKRHMWDDISNG